MDNMIKASEIYKEVLKIANIDDIDSNKRNLNNKLTFLLEQVALSEKQKFKKGKFIMIPLCDAPIVRNLLVLAISGEGAAYDWFNGNVNIEEAEESILLYWQLKEPIMRAEMTGETDSVTVDSWLATIRGIIGFDLAERTVELKRKLENFRVNSIALDSSVRIGDIYRTFENGTREYVIEGIKKNALLSDDLLDNIVKSLNKQEDYFSVLNQIIDKMLKDTEKKSLKNIEFYAAYKSITECNKAYEAIEGVSNPMESMVSEYYPWFQKIADYLKNNPEIAKKIEETTKESDLEAFFRMR